MVIYIYFKAHFEYCVDEHTNRNRNNASKEV